MNTEYTYDVQDQVLSEEDENENVTSYTYDAAGRKVRHTYPQTADLSSGTLNYDESKYDDNGNLTELRLFEYGIDGVTEQQAGPHQYFIQYSYDKLNREKTITRAQVGGLTANSSRVYDSMGNLYRKTEPSATEASVGAEMKYDTLGRLVEVKEGFDSQFSTSLLVPATENGDGFITTAKEYDGVGNVIAETDDRSKGTEYEYDTLQRRTKVTYADSTWEEASYRQDDLVSWLKAYDDVSTHLFTIDYTYDSAKRREAEDYTVVNGPFTGLLGKTFSYDHLDRPTSATATSESPHNSNRKVRLETYRIYDSLDRVVSDQQLYLNKTPNSQTFNLQSDVTVEMEHDGVGNAIRTESSAGSHTSGTFEITRTFDAINRLLTVKDTTDYVGGQGTIVDVAEYSWRGAKGRIEKIAHPWNSTQTVLTSYDARGRPGERRTQKSAGGLLAGRQYGYGRSSALLHEMNMKDTDYDRAFTHDALDRLFKYEEGDYNGTTFDGGTEIDQMEFDGVGSIRKHWILGSGDWGDAIAVDDTNAYDDEFDGIPVERDERGNTSHIGANYFAYDVLGHLVGTIDPIPLPQGPTFEARDAFDRRCYRQDAGGFIFVHEGNRVIQEIKLGPGGVGNTVEVEYLHGAGVDKLVGQRIDGTMYGMHVDHLGTPYAATDGNGDVAEFYSTEPFGKVTIQAPDAGGDPGTGLSTSAIGNQIGFAGMWFDPETNLYFARARHFSPFLRRFMSRDLIGVWGDVTNRGAPYAYVWNNVTLLRDPTGLCVSGRCSSCQRRQSGVAQSTLNPRQQAWKYLEANNPGIRDQSWFGGGNDSTHAQDTSGSGFLTTVHITLGGASMAMDASVAGAAFSWAPDLLDGFISAVEGDFAGAGLSLLGAVPGIGNFANGLKLARYGDEALEGGETVINSIRKVEGDIPPPPRASSAQPETPTPSTQSTSAGEGDFVTESVHTEPSTRMGGRQSGVSIQEQQVSPTTGETRVQHTVLDDRGRVVDDHTRPNYSARRGEGATPEDVEVHTKKAQSGNNADK